MKFYYTKYKDIITKMINHIKQDDIKFSSYDELVKYYCKDNLYYDNYACDYAYKKWKKLDKHQCEYCPLVFQNYVQCHSIFNYLKWAYKKGYKDICIKCLIEIRDNVYIRSGVLWK